MNFGQSILILALALRELIAPGEVAGAAEFPVTALAFSPDGVEILSASQAGISVHRWPGLEPDRRLECPLDNVHDLAFSPDGRLLVAAGGSPGESGLLSIYDWPAATPRPQVRVADDVAYAVAFLDGDALVAATARPDLAFLETRAAASRTLAGHSQAVTAIVRPHASDLFVTAGFDQTLQTWDLAGNHIRTLAIHTAPVLGLAARPGDERTANPYVASVSEDRTVRLWQPRIGRLVRFVRLDVVPLCVTWTADGALLAAGCADGRVRIIDPDSIAVVREVPVGDTRLISIARHPSHPALVVGDAAGGLQRVDLTPP